MATYALVNTSGMILRNEDFALGRQPILAPAKGLRWVLDAPPSFDPATETMSPVAQVAADATEVKYIVVARPLDAVKSDRKAALSQRRFQAEVAGIKINNVQVQTDRDSRGNMTGVTLNAVLNILKTQADPAFSTIVNLLTALGINGFPLNWKAEGIWATLNPTDVIGTANAVRAHVQGCFDNERALSDRIDACTTAAGVLAIDLEAGWAS